ncbi:hypothetical protein RRG08_051948 [Elysia crispata]|uniref:Uncharacterized protein n=1 Tax=Elysia crispata TaxID=231223 RepID=A0AAE0Y2C7_9GAST|nr:hypothetical protein RRG08_051948 [Elysia crispata]
MVAQSSQSLPSYQRGHPNPRSPGYGGAVVTEPALISARTPNPSFPWLWWRSRHRACPHISEDTQTLVPLVMVAQSSQSLPSYQRGHPIPRSPGYGGAVVTEPALISARTPKPSFPWLWWRSRHRACPHISEDTQTLVPLVMVAQSSQSLPSYQRGHRNPRSPGYGGAVVTEPALISARTPKPSFPWLWWRSRHRACPHISEDTQTLVPLVMVAQSSQSLPSYQRGHPNPRSPGYGGAVVTEPALISVRTPNPSFSWLWWRSRHRACPHISEDTETLVLLVMVAQSSQSLPSYQRGHPNPRSPGYGGAVVTEPALISVRTPKPSFPWLWWRSRHRACPHISEDTQTLVLLVMVAESSQSLPPYQRGHPNPRSPGYGGAVVTEPALISARTPKPSFPWLWWRSRHRACPHISEDTQTLVPLVMVAQSSQSLPSYQRGHPNPRSPDYGGAVVTEPAPISVRTFPRRLHPETFRNLRSACGVFCLMCKKEVVEG